jgi:hypothetical protein
MGWERDEARAKNRKLGFIHYNGGLQVHRALLTVVLHD